LSSRIAATTAVAAQVFALGHEAEIVDLNIDELDIERVRAAYLNPADLKKIDVGGGMIHGSARDFRSDTSDRILLAHRAGDLTSEEKEIGSSAAFGTVDVLVAGQSEGMRRHAFRKNAPPTGPSIRSYMFWK